MTDKIQNAGLELAATGGSISGDMEFVNSVFNIRNDAGVSNPNFYRSHDASQGIGLGQLRSRGTIAAPTALIDNDIIGGLTGQGHDGTGYYPTCTIKYRIAGTVSTGFIPTSIEFETTEAVETVVRMVIMPDGKVGIGTVAPTTLLDVAGDVTISGNVNFSGIPISSAGLSAGDLWNNAGILTII
jgi:hypothetical protein